MKDFIRETAEVRVVEFRESYTALDRRAHKKNRIRAATQDGRALRRYRKRWVIGVSRQGHINQSVRVRPRLRDSSLVAGEASRSKSETMKPSDNMLRKRSMRNSPGCNVQ